MDVDNHNAAETIPKRLHSNGFFWACLASLCIAATLALGTVITDSFGNGFDSYCNETTANGILYDIQPELSSHYDSLRVVRGKRRPFPPAQHCLVYGGKYFRSKSNDLHLKYELIAARYHPSPASYLWLILVVLFPVILYALVRLSRLVVRKPVRPQRQSST